MSRTKKDSVIEVAIMVRGKRSAVVQALESNIVQNIRNGAISGSVGEPGAHFQGRFITCKYPVK